MSDLIDNRAFRVRMLKDIIKHLHAGGAPEEAKAHLRTIVRETTAGEIAAMEQELIAEGMPVAEVQSMCDLHSKVLREIMTERREAPIPTGHPVDTLRRENEALRSKVTEMRGITAEIAKLAEDAKPEALLECWRSVFDDLKEVDRHYQRKEHLLFSCLERHGISGPSKVMWGKDDEVRELLKNLGEALAQTEATAAEWTIIAEQVAEPTLAAIEEMIFKEEKILLPMSLETLTENEWAEIWQQSPEYGWCLIAPPEGYGPPETIAPPQPVELPASGDIVLPTGNLTSEQLLALLNHLPVDITFVDAEDRVRYFSQSPDRIFPRSPVIIGRRVQDCHPPTSVHVVEQIVTDFRTGSRDVAEFWIQLHGKFIHIRYFAVHSDKGDYLGTLEVTQDLTRLRTLEGERRLLEYDSPGEGESG